MSKVCEICGKELAKEDRCYCESCESEILQEYMKHRSMMRSKRTENCIICGKPMKKWGEYASMYTDCKKCDKILKQIIKDNRKYLRDNPCYHFQKNKMNKLDEIIKAAKEMGITYGEYVAFKAIGAKYGHE